MKYKGWKRVAASVLTAAMLLGYAPVNMVNVKAAEENTELIVEEVENDSFEASSQQLPTFNDYESALKYVRAKMVARETNFKILLHYTVSERYAGNLYEDAKEYTENCTGQEGDALKWHSSSGRGVKSYYSKEYDLVDFEIEYNSTAAQEAELTKAVKKAMQEMNLNGKSEYEKIKTIYTYIGDHVNYAYDYLEGKAYAYDVHSAYGALCKGEAVCQGYANLFYRLCKEAGLSVRIIGGMGYSECNGGQRALHTWNIVKLNGKYYNVDITWDGSGSETYYNYFLKNNNDLKTSHEEDLKYNEVEFLNKYPMTSVSYKDEELQGNNLLKLNNISRSFTAINGKTVSSSASGKPKLLVFVDASCNTSITTLVSLSEMDLSKMDVVVVDTAQNSKATVTSFASNFGNSSMQFCYDTTKKSEQILGEYKYATGVWCDGNPYIVFIDKNDKCQGVARGACSLGKLRDSLNYYCGIELKEETQKKAERIGFYYDERNMYLGETVSPGVVLYPSDVARKDVKLTSSNPSVVKIDGNGNLVGVKEGKATVTAATLDGSNLSSSYVVNVSKFKWFVREVIVEGDKTKLEPGETLQLKVKVFPEGATTGDIEWKSVNSSIATVDKNGKVTTTGSVVGNTTIKAVPRDGSGYKLEGIWDISVARWVKGITLNKTQLTMELDREATLVASITPSNATNRKLTWTSSDSNVAKVVSTTSNDTVKIHSVGNGTATITVAAQDGSGYSASCVISVSGQNGLAGGISLNQTNVNLKVGETFQLIPTVTPDSTANKEVVYILENGDAVNIEQNGTITGAKAGTATVRVKTRDGSNLSAFCTFNVTGDNGNHGNSNTNDKNFTGLKNEGGTWYYYENGVKNSKKHAMVDYGGGKFLVAGGKVVSGKSGLAQDPVNKSDWYYLANGQAQTKYTGLAQYDGAWFYVNAGKLDTSLKGYVEYDGGLFYVAAGQIKKEVSGLAQDPNTGKWYYLAGGQAQLQYTGLAKYDGEWFYVIDGALAENYTGSVEYDGSTFYVKNGMLIKK